MSHVDEGLIHAWLDGAFAPDDPEHARIEAHLGECEACRRAVEVERRIRERAADVLGAAAPDAVRVEPFQRILERRSRERTGAGAGSGSGSRVGSGGRGVGTGSETDIGSGDGEAGQGERGRPGRGFRIPMALAATLVLAIGATFFARQMMPGTTDAPETQMMDEVAERDAAGDRVAAPPPVELPAPAESERLANEPVPPGRSAGGGSGIREEAPAPRLLRAPTVVAGAQVGTTTVAGRTVEAQAASPPASLEQRNRTPEETRRLANAMMDSLIRSVGDSALRLESVVVTGVASAPLAQVADADAIIAVDRLQDATGTVVWTLADRDIVAARFGTRPLGLTGLDADSVQIGLVSGATVARMVYSVEGQPVELLQWVTGSLNAENEQLRQSQQERRAAEDVVARDDAAAAKAVAPIAPAAFRLDGIDFVLRGTVSPDSLAALAARVGRVE
jgi:hypothetical protein